VAFGTEWWLGGAACPFIIGHCWLRIVAEVSPGTFGIQVVPFGSGSILRAGRQRPIASPRSTPLMVGTGQCAIWNLDVGTACALHLRNTGI